jgi:hypothetical protein
MFLNHRDINFLFVNHLHNIGTEDIIRIKCEKIEHCLLSQINAFCNHSNQLLFLCKKRTIFQSLNCQLNFNL